jgi:hypothetical protein
MAVILILKSVDKMGTRGVALVPFGVILNFKLGSQTNFTTTNSSDLNPI